MGFLDQADIIFFYLKKAVICTQYICQIQSYLTILVLFSINLQRKMTLLTSKQVDEMWRECEESYHSNFVKFLHCYIISSNTTPQNTKKLEISHGMRCHYLMSVNDVKSKAQHCLESCFSLTEDRKDWSIKHIMDVVVIELTCNTPYRSNRCMRNCTVVTDYLHSPSV